MAYGDILEINGQLVEHTPVGYIPVSAERAEGMLTKPAPTTKTTAPTQTLPIGTPTTDPNKTPAGETGGFDPNGGPVGGVTEETGTDAPAPAPETGGIKPMQDVKDEPETPAEMTFTFVEGREKGDAQLDYLYGQTGEVQQLTVDELRDYFEGDDVNRLQEMFGSFNNYLAYMTEREQLIQSGDYDTGNWAEADTGFTEDQQMILEGDADLTIDASDPGQNLENLRRQQTSTQQGAYNNWINSDANQALLEKYGVQPITYSESGDKFRWNGSAYVKTEEVSSPGPTQFAQAGIMAAMTYYVGAGLTQYLAAPKVATVANQATGLGLPASVASGASAGIVNAATQLVMTGDLDFGEALEAAITAGLGSEAIKQIQESGVLNQLAESINEYTGRQDWISLEDGTLFKLVNEYDDKGNVVGTLNRVLMPNGGTLSYENFLQFAAEGTFGSPVLRDSVGTVVGFFREGLETPEFIDKIIEAASNAYTEQGSVTQRVVNFLAGASTSGSATGSMGAVVSGDLNTTADNLTLIRQLQEAIEREEDPEVREALEEELNRYEEETVEEDILEDTTQEATGFEDDEPGITEEMFNDIVGQIREDNQVETQEIIDALAALNVTDLPTLSQIEEAFPELNDVSLTQIQNTVSTLLSDAGLLTTEEFSEAMAEVLTPEQLATALANLPYGDAEDFIEAVANAGYSTPEDIATALNDADLMSNEDFGTYMEQFREDVVGDVGTLLEEAIENFPFPDTFTDAQVEQLRETIVIPEGATMAQVQEALDRLAEQMPAEAPTLQEMSTLLNTALDGLNIASPEDVRTALAEFNFSEEQLTQIINALPEGLNISDLSTALEDVVVGEDLEAAVDTITDLIGDLDIASTEDIRTLLTEYGFTEEQLAQISQAVNIPESVTLAELRQELDNLPENLTAQEVIDLMLESDVATKSDFQTMLDEAFENFAFPDTFTDAQIKQIKDSIVFPSTASMDQIQTALDRLEDQIPEAGPSLDEIQKLFTDTLGGLAIASPQDVRDALSEFEFSESQINQIINALPENISNSDLATALEDVVVGEDLDAAVDTIKETIGNLSIASPDDVRDILTNYGFTEAQLAQIEGAVTIPPSATIADVQRIVDSIPEGLTAEQVATQLSGEFEGLTKDIAGVQSGIDELAESLGLSTDGLLTAISNLSGADGENLTTLQENILAGLGDISEEFGTDISGVVESVTDLTTDVADGIEGLGDQLTGIGEGIGGVQSGIDDLAENLGLSTDALILAISNLGTATGEDLTGLETSVLTGLGDLADNLGLNIGDVVDSVTDLETGLTENITGLSDQLTGVEEAVGGVTTAVTEGVESLADALGVQTDDIEAAIVTLGSGLGGELTDLETNVLLGLTGLADSIGTDVGTVVDSIAGLGTGLGENIQGLSEGLSEQLGTGFEGIGGQLESGFGQLGQQLGLATLGLFGLGAKQPTAQEIAAAQREFKYTPFEEKATPRQVQQVVRSTPVKQQPSALQQINQMIDRQTTTPQIQPMNLGMFTSDPNRKLA